MNISADMQSAWTEYWKGGPTESLPEDRASGLLGALDSAWEEFFRELPDGAPVLDLATGGGDVLRKAVAAGRNFHLCGVDIADLSAVAASFQQPEIRFTGNIDLTSLPFPDAAFDAVTSQFGFEYADRAAAAREAIRVMAPGGRGRFVVHHAASAVTRGSESSLAAYRAVFPDNTVFQLGRAMFECYQTASHPSVAAEAETRFRAAVAELPRRLQNERAFGVARNVVGFLAQLASAPRSLPPSEGLHRLNVVERYNDGRNLRKQAQVEAALDRDGLGRLREYLTAAGATVEQPKELTYLGGRLLAWSCSFRK
jgi:SAM-dependent methyltransferase